MSWNQQSLKLSSLIGNTYPVGLQVEWTEEICFELDSEGGSNNESTYVGPVASVDVVSHVGLWGLMVLVLWIHGIGWQWRAVKTSTL